LGGGKGEVPSYPELTAETKKLGESERKKRTGDSQIIREQLGAQIREIRSAEANWRRRRGGGGGVQVRS